MMTDETPAVYYQKRKDALSKEWQRENDTRKRIAWQRLLIVLLTCLVTYQTWSYISALMIFVEIVIGLTIFLFAVSKDTDAKNKADNLQRLLGVADKEINMLNDNYQQYETGNEFLPLHHAYAGDLDIFGNASLYQYLNRCTSQQGKLLLSQRLLKALQKVQIEEEQQSVHELKNKPQFRQQLQAFGMENHLSEKTEQKINEWVQLPMIYTTKKWFWLANLFPFVSVGLIALYTTDVIPSPLFYLLLFISYLVSISISSKISKTYDMLYKISSEIATLQKQLSWIERETFASQKMIRLHQMLANKQGESTSAEIKKLYAILNRFDIRLNHFAFFFLNTLFVWDLHQLLALNKWKEKNQKNVANWFTVIAETEVSSSLATLSFNKPTWCVPTVTDDFFGISGNQIGHPLLPEKISVANSFSLYGKGKIAIITGSNMGGKSTFLRSLGTNAVLALLGAPVCAGNFSVSCVKLMSSMRVADNLSESASTFYAELKKLKTIIEAVNEKEKVFILLDEILRGTNSLDRHTGSVALLKQLIQNDAVALIATHDVELAKLETGYPQAIQNYHFDVQAKDDELYFDYKLKNGICQSMNASVLMKNIGIRMD